VNPNDRRVRVAWAVLVVLVTLLSATLMWQRMDPLRF
jgi:hypothetical protein